MIPHDEAPHQKHYKKHNIRFLIGGLVVIVPILAYLAISIVTGLLDT